MKRHGAQVATTALSYKMGGKIGKVLAAGQAADLVQKYKHEQKYKNQSNYSGGHSDYNNSGQYGGHSDYNSGGQYGNQYDGGHSSSHKVLYSSSAFLIELELWPLFALYLLLTVVWANWSVERFVWTLIRLLIVDIFVPEDCQ